MRKPSGWAVPVAVMNRSNGNAAGMTLIGAIVTAALLAGSATAATFTLDASEDSMGYEYLDDSSYASSTDFPLLVVDATPPPQFGIHNWRSWIQFSPTDLANTGVASTDVISAVLRLSVNTTDFGFGNAGTPSLATPADIDVYELTQSWTGAPNDTWNTQPTHGALAGGVTLTQPAVGTLDIDITNLVKSWLDNPLSAYGVKLITPDTLNEFAFQFDSLEVGSQGPQLVIDAVPEPASLTALVIGGIMLLRRR